VCDQFHATAMYARPSGLPVSSEMCMSTILNQNPHHLHDGCGLLLGHTRITQSAVTIQSILQCQRTLQMYGLRHRRVASGPGEACARREPFLLDCTYYKPTPLKWLPRMQHHGCGFALAYALLNSANIDRTRPLRTVQQTCLGADRAMTK